MVHSLHSLLVACQEGDKQRVETILNSGEVGVNSADEGEISPLHVAAANGHESIVSLLISKGANVDQRTGSGWTGLHQACHNGHTTCVATLLAAGADINKHNKYGATPLIMASAAGHLDTVRLLLTSGCSVEASVPAQYKVCPTPTMSAALLGHHHVLKALMEAGAKADKISQPSRWTPLMLASVGGSKQSSQVLVEHGADPQKLNLVNATALEIAIATGNTEVRSYLSDMTQMETARYMFRVTDDLNIHSAAQSGDVARVEEILAAGEADVDEVDQEGATPLMMAAIGGHLDVVNLLLRLGAEVNHRDKVNGWTALMQATFYAHKPVISVLLGAGANPTLAANNGCTALDLATLVDDSNTDLVRMLATHSIQIKPPSLEMSKQTKRNVPVKTPRPSKSASVNNLQASHQSSGGIKLWWEKFSGRFKRLNRVDGISRDRLMSVNDLQYSELLPTSPVFTLGFTEGVRVGSPGGAAQGQGSSFLDVSPNFNYQRRHSFQANEKHLGSELPGFDSHVHHHTSSILKTRKLLHSDSVQSPSASLDKKHLDKLKKHNDEKSIFKRKKSSHSHPSVLNILKKLHLEQHYPLFVSNEVDLDAFKEMGDDDLTELGIRNSNDRKAILKSVKKLK